VKYLWALSIFIVALLLNPAAAIGSEIYTYCEIVAIFDNTQLFAHLDVYPDYDVMSSYSIHMSIAIEDMNGQVLASAGPVAWEQYSSWQVFTEASAQPDESYIAQGTTYLLYINSAYVSYLYYYWVSSSGIWQDLSSCQGREVIDFTGVPSYPPPNPPWQGQAYPNHYEGIPFLIRQQTMTDTHNPGSLVQPYIESSVTGSQKYQFRCSYYNSGAWTNVLGPHNFIPKIHHKQEGSWEYEFIKHSQQINLVPLP
jgi:hypothetical protein